MRMHIGTFAEAMNACFINVKNHMFRYRLRIAMERAEETGSSFLGKNHKRRFYEGLVSAKRKDKAFAAQALFACGDRDALGTGKALYICRRNLLCGICGSGYDRRRSGVASSVLCGDVFSLSTSNCREVYNMT